MVRCEQFYEYWERKGNFCHKSEVTAKKVDEYIKYVKRNKLLDYGGFKISHCALDPFISIEHIKAGLVHKIAIRDLKTLIRKEKILPEEITRRVSIEIINKANSKAEVGLRLDKIPNVRNRMREYEHEIGEIGYEVRSVFDQFKKDMGVNNNAAMNVLLEVAIRNPDIVRKIKEDLDKKEKEKDEEIEIVAMA